MKSLQRHGEKFAILLILFAVVAMYLLNKQGEQYEIYKPW